MTSISACPQCMTGARTHYCPGCGHGIIHRLMGEVIDELGIRERTIGIAPVGCAVLLYDYFDLDIVEAAHGRPPAIATGLKRANPDSIVFTYQGDGDLAAIGTAEIIHAANRGEKISVIFVNNSVYGMTGGQMAPTTLTGQVTATTPSGRDPVTTGNPLKIAEMLATLPGTVYVTRVAVNNPANIIKTKKSIRKSFELQMEGKGLSLVEILSPCPSYWRLSPAQAMKRIEEKIIPCFPLGEIKNA